MGLSPSLTFDCPKEIPTYMLVTCGLHELVQGFFEVLAIEPFEVFAQDEGNGLGVELFEVVLIHGGERDGVVFDFAFAVGIGAGGVESEVALELPDDVFGGVDVP